MITSMIFFPEKEFYEKPEQYGFDFEDVRLKTSDGVELFGWFLKAQPEKGTVLFFHGNAGNISGRLYKAEGWVKREFSVLLIDYRSYGKSGGDIKQGEDIVTDAEAVLAWAKENKKLELSRTIFYGESLGSHPAIRLAEKYQAAATVLEAPFTSFKELASIHYTMIPGMMVSGLLKGFEFPNIEHIDKIKTPLFIIHGTRDETCPYEMGERLFEKAPEPKGFLSIPNGAHNDLPAAGGDDFWEKPYEFVAPKIS